MPYYTKRKKFIYFRKEQWFRTDNLLFFMPEKMYRLYLPFSCSKSPFMGKYAYPALKALETANTLLIRGIRAKTTQNNHSVAKPFFTGSGIGYNKHNYNRHILVDSDKPVKNMLLGLAIPFIQS